MTITDLINKEIDDSNAQVVTRINGRDVTRGELKTAFELVQSPNWKTAIDKAVALSPKERLLVAEAVTFFTGSTATFTMLINTAMPRKRGQSVWRVRAAGYYATCGA